MTDSTLTEVAAGEAEESVAQAVRAAAKSNPALAARLARAEAVEAALRADEMHPAPLSLLAGVLEGLRGEPVARALSRRGRFARAAAAVVAAALGAHLALDGGSAIAALSSVATAPSPAALVAPDALPELSLPRFERLGLTGGDPGALLGGGAVAFGAGVFFAWRRARKVAS